MVIEFLFFFCLPTLTGYDCTFEVYMVDDPNDYWTRSSDNIAAMWDGKGKIYIKNWKDYDHEWRHAWCDNYYNNHNTNHFYCMDPHFKIQR